MRCLLFSLVALAGCDNVFRLIPVPEPDIDASEADTPPVSDAPIDAFAGCGVGFIAPGDVDGDGMPNATDPCPQYVNAVADGDLDGLGDLCDPHPDDFGDCIVVLDDFANLDCWTAYETWSACGSGVCSPISGATIELRTPLQFDTGELRGTMEQIGGGGPTVSLMLDDTQAGAALTGEACELLNSGTDIIASAVSSYENDGLSSRDSSTNSPAQVTATSPIQAVIAWQVQTTVVPNYLCTTATASGTVSLSTGQHYPQTAPSGTRPAIRTNQVVFHPLAFIGYGFGAQCAH